MKETTKPFIQLEHVKYSYEEEEAQGAAETAETAETAKADGSAVSYAVYDVSFPVKRGEFLGILGRNGSGKSTIARLINALLLPQEGVVLVDSVDTRNDRMLWEIRSSVGMVFQNPDNQIIGTSVEEDVAFGPENLGIPRGEMIKRVDHALASAGITEIRSVEPHLLSGGQKQRVAIADVLAMAPKCIVLDEATAMLDPQGRRDVLRVVKKLNREEGITVIHITHHMDEVAGADDVVLVENGRIAARGTPRELFSDPPAMRRAGLDVPQVTQLFERLAAEGMAVPKGILSQEEAFEFLSGCLETGDAHTPEKSGPCEAREDEAGCRSDLSM